MRKLVTVLVLVPLGIVIVMFAVANREIRHGLVRSVRHAQSGAGAASAALCADLRAGRRRRCGRRHRRLAEAAQMAGAGAAGRGRGARTPREARRRRTAPIGAGAAGRHAAVHRAAGGLSPIGLAYRMTLRIVTADDINRLLSYDALIDALAEAFRSDIEVPEKIAHFIPLPSGSEAKVLLMPAWTTSGAALHRPQAGERVSGQCEDRQAIGARQLCADVGRHRRAAGTDRRHHAHAVADGRGLRARGALSGPRGCVASGDDRRGRAEPASRARASRRPADQARDDLEPHPLARGVDGVRAVGGRHRAGDRRRSGGGRAAGRHRVLRDACPNSRWCAAPG